MTDSRTKAGNTQDKPGTSHSAKTQGKKTTKEIKQWWVGGSVKKIHQPTDTLPMAKLEKSQ